MNNNNKKSLVPGSYDVLYCCLFSVTSFRCQQVNENSSWREGVGGCWGGGDISSDRLTGSALDTVTHRNHTQGQRHELLQVRIRRKRRSVNMTT